ncbi:hypothetical protein BDN70DRAFT_342549 [Pholiota conissans]|uniref:F-box domain-containing protein n=1 Tax=Pholiota conissans TaxID=109636 RepID=A0A9P5Z7V2_9AGAR|nr:hypothetical protein BDN70DRAFT_342549 [Pholiota conissans]
MVGRPLINYLPNELLAKIFDMGARLPFPVDERYPHRPLFSKIPIGALYATAISQVCIRWREIIFQMPVVWSFIHLTRTLETHRRLKSDLGRSIDWLPVYLRRSRNFPLHITLDTTRVPADAALALINPYSTRWSTFTLLVSHVGSLPPVLPLLVRTRVPRLQYLSISSDIYREGIVCYDPLVPFFVTGTPELATISLSGVYVAWNALPLSNLRNLELHFTSRWPNFAHLQDMFDASPMLERLIIHDDIASILRHVQQPFSMPTVTLGRLKYLEIEAFRIRDEPADVAGLLGLFSMDILESLMIREITVDEWVSIIAVYDLPVFAFPGFGRATRTRGRLPNRRLTKSFPFLQNLVVTAASIMPRSPTSPIR